MRFLPSCWSSANARAHLQQPKVAEQPAVFVPARHSRCQHKAPAWQPQVLLEGLLLEPLLAPTAEPGAVTDVSSFAGQVRRVASLPYSGHTSIPQGCADLGADSYNAIDCSYCLSKWRTYPPLTRCESGFGSVSADRRRL